MATATGLVIRKKFLYRNNEEEWSNKYWLTGAPPTTSAEWRTLFDQLVLLETRIYRPATQVVGGIGYKDNDPHAFADWVLDLELEGTPVPGTLVVAAGNEMAGDQASMLEWRTERKNTRGKWIYLRKYFHDGGKQAAAPDYIETALSGVLDQLGTDLMMGTWAGGRKIRSQKQDEIIQASISSPYVTTRTLKRRAKKKST
jgi:hypothetical protein